MRSKVPNDIHIMLKQAKIHASGIVVVQVPERSVVD